jgi:hypothetical protein
MKGRNDLKARYNCVRSTLKLKVVIEKFISDKKMEIEKLKNTLI